jgi:hypothetical protein
LFAVAIQVINDTHGSELLAYSLYGAATFSGPSYLALGAGAVYAALAAYARRVAARAGGSLRLALATCIGLLVWMWSALQLLVTGARAASAAAPPWLAGLFAALLTLQFEGVTVNPSCLD